MAQACASGGDALARLPPSKIAINGWEMSAALSCGPWCVCVPLRGRPVLWKVRIGAVLLFLASHLSSLQIDSARLPTTPSLAFSPGSSLSRPIIHERDALACSLK